jgi:uncharacterized protein with NRDE domain
MPKIGYGTRTQTVLTIDGDWNCTYVEVTMSPHDPETWLRTEMKFKVGAKFGEKDWSVKQESVPAPTR